MKFLIKSILVVMMWLTASCNCSDRSGEYRIAAQNELESLNQRLNNGWNTWDVHDVLSQVWLPECFSISAEIISKNDTVRKPYLGKNWQKDYFITPKGHAFDGSYSDMMIQWREMKIRVQTAAEGDQLVVLFTGDKLEEPLQIDIKAGMKWGRAGLVTQEGSSFNAKVADKIFTVYPAIGTQLKDQRTDESVISFRFTGVAGISTQRVMSLEEMKKFVSKREQQHIDSLAGHSENREIWDALQSVFAWNTIYDPINNRIFTPVSRSWCEGHDFVLFEWDTYFGAYQLSWLDKDLSYANLWAITSEITPEGIVPNFTTGIYKSTDRSQPPVGSMVAREVYRKTGERWILDLLFDDLLKWNRWWPQYRDKDGYLCWGSNPIPLRPEAGQLDLKAINKLKGAKYESGLDNSPMYDDIPYDSIRHMMKLADVGLISMYIGDCNALDEIAGIIGRKDVRKELQDRAKHYGASLKTLWDEESGIFLNKNLETGEFSRRISPTNFYPLLSGVPTRKQANRMIREHFYNPEEFWGDWILPSISRNDPAYSNQYWRGRIWGPMNCLVYMGLSNYNLPEARADLASKSSLLLLKTFRKNRMVHENYNPDTGEGSSDDYYHWGGLLGFLSILEEGRDLKNQD